ncbi:MAG: hypothetical protein JKX84_11060 [Flavobacteriales bacterium]|nr:hypothetical protein [Flavobacteriales bacterium]
MDITPAHWIFAALFALTFIVLIIGAYLQDMKKTPELFKGSSKFLIGVILLISVLIVVKILYRLSS